MGAPHSVRRPGSVRKPELKARRGAPAACSNPECGEYPYYGVAPHECFYKKGPEFTVGQSTLLPRAHWPDSFVLDLMPGEDPETVAYPSACGVYYCPDCRAGMAAPPAPSIDPTPAEPPQAASPPQGGGK